ncbi:MAG: response regulator [Burkholderiaceae bacterium]|nr:response regulator [Burkholderiaceae bacterium]
MRILLVEDDPDLSDVAATHLRDQSHAVDVVGTLKMASAAVAGVTYDLILLDLGLPDGDGVDWLGRQRRAGQQAPVLILTARDQISQRIRGLDAGADDYLTKPYDLHELGARVRAIGRRHTASSALQLGAVRIDLSAHRVLLEQREVRLTSREWAVLEALALRPGHLVTRARLEDALFEFGAELESNVLEVYISQLRRKLGRQMIETVRGLGYRLGFGQEAG